MSRRPVQLQQATIAARRYFLDGWTVKQIGAELGISRFKAARLLEWARAEGVVRIEIDSAVESDVELSERLRGAFELRDAIVVAGLDGPSEAITPELAEVAADVIAEVVRPSDVVGISWGHTLDLVVEKISNFSAKRVVQLVGGQATMESASGGIEVVKRLASKGRATGYPLLAPLRLHEPAAVDALRRDPVIGETLELINDVNVVLAGVGAWGEPPISRMIECFSEEEVSSLRRRGVVADLCGFLFDGSGHLPGPHDNHRIGISLEQLDAAGTVLAVCGGNEKRRALAAVLRSGLVDIVVTDAGSAGELLGA
ncbi:MAG TPA: sugar-binding domain-containing protein [Acidimicrobiales bacterium]|nr:sugar-binding domain-containing protein [Acidimicrobiales bacterium]